MKLYDIVEYLGDENLLVFKHPCEDFNTNTKLIVRESQVAIFVKNGQICDVFTAGRYNLKTENIPILKKLINIGTNGETSFSAEVYFFDTKDVMDVNWGTATPMMLQDPVYNIVVKVGASGSSFFRIVDCVKMLRRLVGVQMTFDKKHLQSYFRSLIVMFIKNSISDAITKGKVPILELQSKLLELAQNTNNFMNIKLEEYGLKITNFTIDNIVIPEDDMALKSLRQTLNKKASMDVLGYSYNEERSFDVMQDLANNQSNGGNFANAFMGLGMGFGIAKSVGNNMNNLTNTMTFDNNGLVFCNKCGNKCDKASLFCNKCGAKLIVDDLVQCAKCNNVINKDSQYCSFCGNKVERR